MKTAPHPRLAIGLLTLAVSAAAGAAHSPGAPFSLSRNAQGVALIKAPTLAGAAAGLGYAYAQDNFCLLQDYLMTVNGERSRYLGPDGMVLTQTERASTTNLASDIFYRFYVDGQRASALYANADEGTRQLVSGYVSGVNRYLSQTPSAAIDPACRGKAWVRPITAADMHKIFVDKAILASGANFIEAIAGAAPPAATQQASSAVDLDTLLQATRPQLPLASNAWAFGRDTVAGGGSLLLGNPHFPWTGSNRFYQAQMTVPGMLDVTGAALGGVPIIQIGYNRTLSWTHTVSTGRRFTFFELALKPGNPLVYVVDGMEKPMEAVDINVPVLVNGALSNVSRRLYRTQFGPVITIPRAGLGWTQTRAYAFADINASNNRVVKTWLDLVRAKNVRQARAAMERNMGIPWVNTVAADATGEVLYADLTAMPNVDHADIVRCAPSPQAAALLRAADLLVLRGTTSDCAWKNDSSSPAPGLVPPSRLPVAIRTDFVANSNDSYWLTNPAITWDNISPMAGPVAVPQRLRTRAGLTLIARRLNGTDGLPGRQFTPRHLERLFFNSDNYAAAMVLDDLLTLAGNHPAVTLPDGTTVQLASAWHTLAAWDRRSAVHSRGAHLFREFWRTARAIPNLHRTAFDPQDPVNTPAGLMTGDAAVRTALLQALGGAVRMFDAAGIAPGAPLGTVQYLTVRGKKIAVPGGEEFEGVLNKVESRPFADGQYQPFFGTSYLQIVALKNKKLNARGILTYSQSTDPRSPYYFDQLPAFSRGQLYDLPEPDRTSRRPDM
ncbi:penicillin acylase family protein [Massilia sp. PAMC28688]|uniref:penicillin acylase family protein n=1 Tax=Massilia sp. PAMC28688 TaxID=2861283 RepID=UPI001C629CCF|nr:penicillin acylase family protein [Massilia sp. PAMC28688]QYF95267.1 penicillin acylase family protein [Massilia sp. PAMC28688]